MLNCPSEAVLKPDRQPPLSRFNNAVRRLYETLEVARCLRQEISNEQESGCPEVAGGYQCVSAALNNGPSEIEELAGEIERQLDSIRKQLL